MLSELLVANVSPCDSKIQVIAWPEGAWWGIILTHLDIYRKKKIIDTGRWWKNLHWSWRNWQRSSWTCYVRILDLKRGTSKGLSMDQTVVQPLAPRSAIIHHAPNQTWWRVSGPTPTLVASSCYSRMTKSAASSFSRMASGLMCPRCATPLLSTLVTNSRYIPYNLPKLL